MNAFKLCNRDGCGKAHYAVNGKSYHMVERELLFDAQFGKGTWARIPHHQSQTNRAGR